MEESTTTKFGRKHKNTVFRKTTNTKYVRKHNNGPSGVKSGEVKPEIPARVYIGRTH